MEEEQATVYVERCPYCFKEIRSLYPIQTKGLMKHHILSCKANPENIKDNIKKV